MKLNQQQHSSFSAAKYQEVSSLQAKYKIVCKKTEREIIFISINFRRALFLACIDLLAWLTSYVEQMQNFSKNFFRR